VLRLSNIIKNYKETGALNEHVSLFGFIDDHTFITKGGDLGVILKAEGVDYECQDQLEIDNIAKRLQAAIRLFDPRYRIYQYLFKSNHEPDPLPSHPNPYVDMALKERARYFQQKADRLYSLQIYYVILFEGFRYKQSFSGQLAGAFQNPAAALRNLAAYFSSKKQAIFVQSEIENAHKPLLQQARNFISQLSDLVHIQLLPKQDAYRVLRRLLNVNPVKLEHSKLKYDTLLDKFLVDSAIECFPKHLLIDDYHVRVISLKEPTAQTWPLILRQLFEVEANYHIVTEWKPLDNAEARKQIDSMRRHFHNAKTSVYSQASGSTDVLVDESKQSLVRTLGQCLEEIELKGNYFGKFSLTIVLYSKDPGQVEKTAAQFYKIFSMYDGSIYEETYNQLNAFFATLPGNYPFNLRQLYILNSNYADYSFLFTLHEGERWNSHLNREYLAKFETGQGSPYYFNLHYHDTAHSLILGRTGSGKSFLLNFLITNMQKYDPYTFIFDLGESYKKITHRFDGTYLKIGVDKGDFSINPFVLELNTENHEFLFSFIKVLIESGGDYTSTNEDDKNLFEAIETVCTLDKNLRRLKYLSGSLPKHLGNRLQKWIQGGQYGHLFDNAEDNLTFSHFQCFDFEGMDQYPQIIEPLLFYVLHRANNVILDPKLVGNFKAFFVDEAWRFFNHPVIRKYIIEALKTWRKKNGAMILATQSLDELKKSEILDIVNESCATKIFLANPAMDHELYAGVFHLNEHEIEIISNLVPKREGLIKTPAMAKKYVLEVDPKSYWLYTNNPKDNQRYDAEVARHGFEKALEILSSRSNHA